MKKAAWLAAGLAVAGVAHAAELTPVQQQMRSIYQELVETNTTNSIGSCTLAAQKNGQAPQSGRFQGQRNAGHRRGPKKGNLVARLKGDGSKKPLLLLAHIDVVEANREDWERDPFKLVEENGMFYARGASDDKAMAAPSSTICCCTKRKAAAQARHHHGADLR
jgi:acetylornithine deacetylase/succinyl-diaminopimelate desuccinylase-like protein